MKKNDKHNEISVRLKWNKYYVYRFRILIHLNSINQMCHKTENEKIRRKYNNIMQ